MPFLQSQTVCWEKCQTGLTVHVPDSDTLCIVETSLNDLTSVPSSQKHAQWDSVLHLEKPQEHLIDPFLTQTF